MKKILVLTYWSYKNALVQTYTLPYVRIIKDIIGENGKVFLFTIEQEYFRMNDDEWKKEKKKLEMEGIILLRMQYLHFGMNMIYKMFKVFISLKKLIKKENISHIHAWCTPAGSLGYFLSLFSKRPLIIDSYEPHAEAMVENGTWNKSSLKFKLLFWLEKKQSQKADTVIALTEGMKNYAKEKYNTSFKNYHIKPALVDLNKFNHSIESYNELRKRHNVSDKVVCLYAGKLGGIYFEEEVFDFFKAAFDYWQDRLKVYLLTDKKIEEVEKLIKDRNVPKNTIETKFIEYKDIHTYFHLADFAINPVKPVPSKRYCTSIKDGEYWASGLPIVITKNISDDSDIIETNNIGYVLKELSETEYTKACKEIDSLLQNKDKLNDKIVSIAKKYRRYEIAQDIYKNIYL